MGNEVDQTNSNNINKKMSNGLASIQGLELLFIRDYAKTTSLPLLTNLKGLIIRNGANAVEMEYLANSLVKLERLNIEPKYCNDILPFIMRSKRLNKLPKYFPGIKRALTVEL